LVIRDIRFNGNGKGLIYPKIPPSNQLVWKAFEIAVEVAINNCGKSKQRIAQSG
jgi:hypothetical protein